MFQQVGRWEAQQTALALKHNGGKAPTTTAEQNAANTAITKAQCQAAKSLDIQVSPQFGRLDYTQLRGRGRRRTRCRARPGTPSPASTQGLVPAC